MKMRTRLCNDFRNIVKLLFEYRKLARNAYIEHSFRSRKSEPRPLSARKQNGGDFSIFKRGNARFFKLAPSFFYFFESNRIRGRKLSQLFFALANFGNRRKIYFGNIF